MAMNTSLFVESTTNTITKSDGSTKTTIEPVKGTNGALYSTFRAGTGKQQYRYSFAASTRETINFPPGADITEITVMASLNAAPASVQAVAHIKGLLCIDAVSDVDAENVLSGTTYPDSNTLTQRFDVIPLNVPITIPLSAKLANGTNSTGRIDVRTSDTTIALDWFILGN